MPTINHTITVSINGTNRASLLLKDSLYIRTSVGNKGDTASFSLHDTTGAFMPLDWDEVTIAVNGTTVFGGYITSRQASGIGAGSTKTAVWNIECRDWSAILDTVVITRSYVDTADTAIIDDLFDTYLSSEGFDDSLHVNGVDSDVDVNFDNITIRAALTLLAEVAGAKWHIAPDKSVYWYSPTAPDNAAFNIDVVSPNNSTSFDVLAGSLRYGSDANTIINRMTVIGGEEESGKVTETFAANGTKNTFGPLAQKPGSIWKVTFYVGGVLNTVFADGVGYEPGDSLRVDGGDYNVLVNLESRYVQVQKINGDVPDNATNVVITYYTLTPVVVTVEDGASQGEYNRVFEQTVYDENYTSSALAQAYAEQVINEYAYGRETIRFDVTEHGLLPGRLITVNAPVLGAASTYDAALALENRTDVLLLEDGVSRLMLESYGESRKYLIQEVTIRTVVTGSNKFMVVASVSCGKYVPTLIDSLSGLQSLSAGSGRLPALRTVGRLDRLANDLGEVVAGRAVFTDGGTAPFTWSNYADHTGAVIGLEEDGSNAYGAMYILDDGTVKAKIGRMDGLGSVGTVSPSGWGIWTNNGYFSGALAATSGEIGGWVIAENLLYAVDGVIATRPFPINSSNPGVYMSSDGLFGYGTLGLTFSIPSDPALRPYFSSGTIINTVYEVTTASVLRTGTAGARVQMDNSGIFAYDSGNVARFTVDASTGRLTASQGTFSGTVSASTVSGGTVTGAVFTGGTVTQGTVSAAVISGGTVTGSQISGGTVTGGQITGGTVTGALFSGGTVSLSSGTLTITSSGINHTQSGLTNSYSDSSSFFNRLTTNGTVLGYFGQYTNGTTAYFVSKVGYEPSNQIPGYYEFRAGGHPFATYDWFRFNIDGNWGAWFDHNGGKAFEVSAYSGAGSVVTSYNLIPNGSGGNLQLGDSSNGFRYLYLKDDNGSVRRVSINSSGVLTVT